MARWWKERYDSRDPEHGNKMLGTYGDVWQPLSAPPRSNLEVRWVYFVAVCSFTFSFQSLDHLRACLRYYSRKIHPSGRIDRGVADHWEVQRWHERLPLYLREEPKRQKVVQALSRALAAFVMEEGKPGDTLRR
ncbi:MAG TPA: hypothetical protein VLA19_06975 [Herpetosiphonaceae bacterium]|nr:hypothetical protein [Herpetosiphonaceae bacterium]